MLAPSARAYLAAKARDTRRPSIDSNRGKGVGLQSVVLPKVAQRSDTMRRNHKKQPHRAQTCGIKRTGGSFCLTLKPSQFVFRST